MTYRYVENPPTHCATLLGDKFGKEIIYQIIKKKKKMFKISRNLFMT